MSSSLKSFTIFSKSSCTFSFHVNSFVLNLESRTSRISLNALSAPLISLASTLLITVSHVYGTFSLAAVAVSSILAAVKSTQCAILSISVIPSPLRNTSRERFTMLSRFFTEGCIVIPVQDILKLVPGNFKKMWLNF